MAAGVSDFLTHLEKERDVSPNTVTAYRRDLAEFTEYLGHHYGESAWNWSSIDRLTMRGFLAHLQRRGLGKRSIARLLSAIRSFYKFLANTDDVDVNTGKMVGTPKA